MAFKRYAALLAGTALAGSALFAQPAMAEETEFSYEAITVEQGGTVTSEAPKGKDQCSRIVLVSAQEAGQQNLALAKELGATVNEETGLVTIDQTELAIKPEVKKNTLNIACAIEKEGKATQWKTAPLEVDVTAVAPAVTIADVTVTEGKTKDFEVKAAEGVTGLNVTAPEGLDVKYNDGKLTVNATKSEAKEYTVTFTYKANGKDETGSFKVTVKKAEAPAPVVQKIDDVTVTEGKTKDFEVKAAEGVTGLNVTAPEGLDVKYNDGKLTVNATKSEAKEYTVTFTYKANGKDETGSFKVTVKKAEENASSKFVGSFKGLSSK